MLPIFIFRVPFFCYGKKMLEATSRANMGPILEPRSHVAIATLVTILLAMAMEIWDRECGPFRAIFAVFVILGQVGNAISPRGKDLARRMLRLLWHMTKCQVP